MLAMRFLSLCSGIEAASVAWNPLGWETAAVAEVDPFCCQLLSQRHPAVPNLGDLNEHGKWPSIKPDLIVAGTPCQAFSVAGLRRGLSDPRGGLMLRFLEVVSRERPRYVLWENVPGALSSSGGRDFGTLLWSLAQLGYGVAYRVLDASGFGVPQRRRRVFALGCLGDWKSPCKILLEPEGVPGDAGQSGKAKHTDTGATPDGAAPADIKWVPPNGKQIAGCLMARDYKGVGNQDLSDGRCTVVGVPSDSSLPMVVRKMTPVEYERLQGFPDDYTRISYRKRPADKCPDGPRYKALGNSMAVPVMRWIAQRIQMECRP
jgi:DNA (cytosine-5)-methyltransferase 1